MNNIEHWKKLLSDEKKDLLGELRDVGRENASAPGGFEATVGDDENVDAADENSLADKFEQFEERSAVEAELGGRMEEIDRALARIEDGTFGSCRVCKKTIEDARLEANPAAETCKSHLNSK